MLDNIVERLENVDIRKLNVLNKDSMYLMNVSLILEFKKIFLFITLAFKKNKFKYIHTYCILVGKSFHFKVYLYFIEL